MTSRKQIEANQLNALNAGVKTESGRLIVRHNAVRHGLCSKTILSGLRDHNENFQEYGEILDGYINTFTPQNTFESHLVEVMARSQFKLKRYELLEVGCFEDGPPPFGISPAPNSTPPLRLGPDSSQLELAWKYHAILQGQFYRAFQTLLSARDAARQLDLFGNSGGCDEVAD